MNCTCKKFLLFLILITSVFSSNAQRRNSDNGDGTYTNPLIASDFPDPDVIFVDDTYYMVSTTMFIFPGVTILKSKDLVNWEYCSNAVPRFEFSSCYDLDGCDRYSHGQWATSMKYHNGKFYLLFITLDEGGFICSADQAEGPWEITKLPRGFYDPGLFFDDDGKIYVVHGYGDISMTEVDENFTAISDDQLVFTGDIRSGLEGSHVYKINGYYYLYSTYGGTNGIQVALRSTNIYGPYEEKIVIEDLTPGVTYGIHQGALIQTQTGEWWTILFVDSGPFGRFPSLQPVTWVDDWPMVGVDGKAVITYTKPDVGAEYPVTELPTSDEFDETTLGMQWGWNHNPDDDKWSLTENPGFMRLKTAKVVSSLPDARNTLTQRMFASYDQSLFTIGSTKMEIGNMTDGDIAGLAVFQSPYAYIAVKQENGEKSVIMVNNGTVAGSTSIENVSTIYLRAIASNVSDVAIFEYSFDNEEFNMIGNSLSMQFNLDVFTGNKFCLFNYATTSVGGYVDFDWFKTEQKDPYAGSSGTNIWLEAECTEVGSNWDIIEDENSSNGKYLTVKSSVEAKSSPSSNSDDYLIYTFHVSAGGDYKIWGRELAPTPDDDSFWVKMDNGDWINWNGIVGSSSWQWDDVHNQSDDSPMVYSLDTGYHTLMITYREDGAAIDKLCLTKTGQIPSGLGGDATNCGDIPDHNATVNYPVKSLTVIPNPVLSDFTVECSEPFNTLLIYDIKGNTVFEKFYSEDICKEELNLDLKNGMYFIQVRGNNTGNSLSKFIVIQ